MPLTSEPEWDVCTSKALLEEALACIRAVHQEVKHKMPNRTRQIEAIQKAVEDIIRSDENLKDSVVQNYKAELKKIRQDIANTDWDKVGPPKPPK